MPTPSIWVRYCGKALMRALKAAPVILVAPVGNERLSLLEGDALRPVADGFPHRPPRGRQSTLEIVQRCLGYMDLKGRYVLCRRGEHDLRSLGGAPMGTYLHPR